LSEAQKHLTQEQVDRLVETQPREPGDVSSTGAQEEARRHLANCQDCQRLVHMHEEIAGSLRRLAGAAAGPRSAACPSDEELCELAAGILAPERAEAVLEHVTSCDHCGPLLKQAVEELAAEPTTEENALVDRLPSAQPAFAAEMGRRLAERQRTLGAEAVVPPAPRAPRRTWWALSFAWGIAAAAVVIVALGAVWMYRRTQPAFAEQLLAEAYTQQRTMELRIPGALPAPLRIERGGGDRSQLSRPTALLEAEALIAEELAKHPEDPRWLEARGHAELLDWNYEAAIKSFKRALDVKPDTPELLTGLATAYFQRAEAQDRAIDYGQAIEYLGQSLARRPDDPVALYNRAIAAEKMFLYQQAIEDWEHYLRVDPNGAWVEESKQRLESLKKKIKSQENSRPALLTDPAAFVQWAKGPAADADAAPTDSQDEEYLDLAVREWLPALRASNVGTRPARASWRSNAHWEALEALAARLERKHGDRWLGDLLRELRVGGDAANAFQLLSSAVQLNQTADRESSSERAHESAARFQRAAIPTGAERAQFEEIYAMHLSYKGGACYESATALVDLARRRSHTWLLAQALLELSICSEMTGRDIDGLFKATRNALDTATEAHYGTIGLRAIAILAFQRLEYGEPTAASSLAIKGLARYWDGSYPAMRAYSLYACLEVAAEHTRLPFMDVSSGREAVRTISRDPDLVLRGFEEQRLARAQLEIGDLQGARDSFEGSERLFASAPQGTPERNLAAEAEVGLASVELLRGESLAATRRLRAIGPQFSQISNRVVQLGYLSTLGAALAGVGDAHGAEEALASAIRIAEDNLRTQRSDQEQSSWMRQNALAYKNMSRLVEARSADEALGWWEMFRGAPLRAGQPFSHGSGHDPMRRPTSLPPLSMPWNQTALISYVLFDDGAIAWVFDGRHAQLFELQVGQKQLESLAKRFGENCSQRDADREILRKQGGDLYSFLVAPLERAIRGRTRLMIETDGALDLVPFEALIDKEGKYLGDSYSVLLSPGVQIMAAAHEAATNFSSSSQVLVVASPAPPSVSQIAALPNVREEADSILVQFPVSRLLWREEATQESMRRRLPHTDIFHFVGHATVVSGLTGLIIRGADGEQGVPLQLDGHSLRRCRLVVLSACATARGPEGILNDPGSLARSVLLTGVPKVVASRWDVDSSTTVVLMNSFYSQLSQGVAVPEALRMAMTSVRGLPGKDRPYYWAAFASFGISR